MGNSYVLLVGVLGLLLARKGAVEARQCYSCSDCATLSPSENIATCSASCLTTITCQDNGDHFVTRLCSVSNKNTSCVTSSTSANTHECYCNNDLCDILPSNPNICNAAFTVSVTSLALVLAALVPTLLLA